jgi:predicted transposase YbfD/YdcC
MAGLRGYEDGVGWQTMAMVEAWRPQGEVASYERRSYISRLGVDAKPMAESVRGHGASANALHGVLDIAVREDDSRSRKGHAAETFSMRRPIALNLLKQAKTSRHGVNVKSNRAGWDNNYLLTVLGIEMRSPWGPKDYVLMFPKVLLYTASESHFSPHQLDRGDIWGSS